MVCLTFYALQVVLPLVSTRNFCCEYWVAWKISSRLKEAGWSTSLRSRHWHSCQFSLASCSWAHQFQTGGPCVPSSARHCTSILVWLSLPCCWLAVSLSSTVGDLQPTWCAPVVSRNCRRPFIWLCWFKALEQSPWWHYIGFIAVSLQKKTENSFISAILSGHYFVVCYGFLLPSWSLKLFVT